jgi:hypothetical protein
VDDVVGTDFLCIRAVVGALHGRFLSLSRLTLHAVCTVFAQRPQKVLELKRRTLQAAVLPLNSFQHCTDKLQVLAIQDCVRHHCGAAVGDGRPSKGPSRAPTRKWRREEFSIFVK